MVVFEPSKSVTGSQIVVGDNQCLGWDSLPLPCTCNRLECMFYSPSRFLEGRFIKVSILSSDLFARLTLVHPVRYADEITTTDRALEVHEVCESRPMDWALPFMRRKDFGFDVTAFIAFEITWKFAHQVTAFDAVHADFITSLYLT